jgi:hypothetical protein
MENGEHTTQGDSQEQPKEEQKTSKRFEEKLDNAAEKFSRTMSEGIKRMEDSFEQSKKNIKDSTNISQRYKGIFNYPTGGFLLLVVGFVWLMYTVGFFDQKIFPIILVIVGLYMMLKKRGS